MDLRARLERILRDIGPENIWRPIYDTDDMLLADGIADSRDGCPEELAQVDFQDKTVLDLGCNFGFHSFLARRLGAASVVGVDRDEMAVSGARLLQEMKGYDRIEFLVRDFTSQPLDRTYDIVMLVNFIGKEMVSRGIAATLKAVEKHAGDVLLISARYSYRIAKHLGGDAERLHKIYPAQYFNRGYFHLVDYLRDFYNDNWNMSIITTEDACISVKRTILFTRKRSPQQ